MVRTATASYALRRCDLPATATQEMVWERLSYYMASIAEDYARGPGNRILEPQAHADLLMELEEYRVLFGCADHVGVAASGAAMFDPLPFWAGCWCKGDIVFTQYSK